MRVDAEWASAAAAAEGAGFGGFGGFSFGLGGGGGSWRRPQSEERLVSIRLEEDGWQWSGALPVDLDDDADTCIRLRHPLRGAVLLLRAEVRAP